MYLYCRNFSLPPNRSGGFDVAQKTRMFIILDRTKQSGIGIPIVVVMALSTILYNTEESEGNVVSYWFRNILSNQKVVRSRFRKKLSSIALLLNGA
jgi:hypothetical protein